MPPKRAHVVNAPPRMRLPWGLAIALLALCLYGRAALSDAPKPAPPTILAAHSRVALPAAPEPARLSYRGRASWYGPGLDGGRTASGERFDMHDLTAAHRTLPLGSYAQVKNLSNGRSVVVRINDRGPHTRRRAIDLSYAAAKELRMVGAGTARVEIAPLSR